MAAVVVSLTGLAVPGAADAASAPLRRKPHAAVAAETKATTANARAKARAKAPAKARVKAKPRPGPRGHQSVRGSHTSARQHHAGNGQNIQNLNGVNTPSLLSGPQSTTVTSAGSITSQGVYCASGGQPCEISQNMR